MTLTKRERESVKWLFASKWRAENIKHLMSDERRDKREVQEDTQLSIDIISSTSLSSASASFLSLYISLNIALSLSKFAQ